MNAFEAFAQAPPTEEEWLHREENAERSANARAAAADRMKNDFNRALDFLGFGISQPPLRVPALDITAAMLEQLCGAEVEKPEFVGALVQRWARVLTPNTVLESSDGLPFEVCFLRRANYPDW